MKKKFLLLILLFINVFAFAQNNIKTNWQAFWIGEKIPSIPNTFYKYRKQFDVNTLPQSAKTSIAVDSKYWLYINDSLVIFEGQLKRGPTPNDTYYDEIDIAPFLQKGKNTIAVLVWYWGKDGFSHKSSGKAGLLFETDLGSSKIISDTSWKIQQHLAYQNTTSTQPNFRLSEHNIRYNANVDNEEWIKQNYNDSSWKNAQIITKANAAPWNALWKRPLPQWHNSGLVNYTYQKLDSGKLVAHLPKNISVTPYIKINAPAGLLIDIRTDNYNGGNAQNVRTEYITKAGIQEFESPAYFTGHQVIYTIPEGVEVIEAKYRETKYNAKVVGSFSSNDNFYNKLWEKSATTLNVNMRDGIFDSPERERAQWWGDIVIVLEEMFYSYDADALPLIKKSISNLLEWQKKDGVLFSPIPAGNWDKELPAQILAAVSKYGIWKYIEQSGDTDMIRYAYPFIKKYMQLWELNKKGLVKHRKGDWDWHDWGDKIDVPLLDNAWYYMALESSFNMASFLKLNDEANAYQTQMQSIKLNFQKYFWKGNRFASNNYKFYADDRANGLAVCAGLVSTEQWKKIKPILDTTFYAGPYLEKYILESYFIMDDAAAGLARMKKRYTAMVNHPSITTLWEGWEIGSDTYGGGTYNHGWTGGPLSLLSGYAAGIRATSLGYNNYIIKPQLGTLKKVDCTTLTAKGFIKINIENNISNLVMQVTTIDANGIIAIPKTKQKNKLTINGKSKQNLFTYKNEDDKYWYYECNVAGTWKIVNE
jgi:alpha-L-rhamnosidase